MKIEQIYTNCLAQGAYYIESEGEAIVIDPLRESNPYIERAKRDNAQIKYILETHFHADFVSGHVDLANKTGATIVYGPNAKTDFEAHIAQDNEILKIGNIEIKVLHTPGHTMESSCYLLFDENKKAHALFSGDTLFLGDVGRPDLAIKTELSEEDLAGHLYDSLRNKIMVLDDDVIVYPAHGAGSACGKNMSKETIGSIGYEKANNYALADMTKEAFVKEVLTGLGQAPQYFAKNALMNKQGADNLDTVFDKGLNALSVEEFEELANNHDILILDTRAAQTFKDGFVSNAINIGIDGSFAPWIGALIQDIRQAIIIISEEGREKEVITRLARVGYDNILGYLKGGIDAWISQNKSIETVQSISAQEFEQKGSNIKILDVRKPNEYLSQHIVNAQSLPLGQLNEKMEQISSDQEYFIHCQGGYRSMIALSILKSRGFNNIIDVAGGFNAIKQTAIPMTSFVCPSKLV